MEQLLITSMRVQEPVRLESQGLVKHRWASDSWPRVTVFRNSVCFLILGQGPCTHMALPDSVKGGLDRDFVGEEEVETHFLSASCGRLVPFL